MLNAFTVDLEDWFCVSNMDVVFTRADWDGQEPRIEIATSELLALLRESSVRATFFVLGWIAERFPALIEKIYRDRHEIGIHGYDHQKVGALGPNGFAADLEKALTAVTAIVPREAIAGYRAPSFSISPETAWAFDILRDHGISYDSSVNPVSGHPDYGWPGFSRRIHALPNGLPEVPMTPLFGGGYFRMFPYAASRAIARRANANGLPAIFYMHPWEIDPGQPRIALPPIKRFRHYINLGQTMKKINRLLSDFKFGAIGDILAAQEI